MAHLKDLFVSGPARFLSKLRAGEIEAERFNAADAAVVASHPFDRELHLRPGEREKWTPDPVLSAASDRPVSNKAVAGAGFATMTEVQQLLGSSRLKKLFPETLPDTDIDMEAIYLIKAPEGSSPDLYLEYINYTGTPDGWELLGGSSVRLEDYYTKTEVRSLFTRKEDVGAKANLATADKSSLVAAVNELFASGNGIKAQAAAAVSSMGQAAAVTEPWQDILNKIKAIKTVLTGTATPAQVLSGSTFYSIDAASRLTGAMADQGAKTAALNCGASYAIPRGYHNGSGRITANTLASQTAATAAAANLTSGKTAWVNGVKITGNGSDCTSYYTTGYNAGRSSKAVSALSLSLNSTAANGNYATGNAPGAGWCLLFKCDQDASFFDFEFQNVTAGAYLQKDSNRRNSSYAARAYIYFLNMSYS